MASFPCHKCGYVADSLAALAAHLLSHALQPPKRKENGEEE